MKSRKYFLVIPLVALLILSATEVFLRTAGFLLQNLQNKLNKVTSEDDRKLRILALGESTTAEYFADSAQGGSWPRILEQYLNKSGIPARVYNEAVGGTSSPILISHLPEYLDIYRPHIVIAMMGVNDVHAVILDETPISKMKLAVSQIRVVKLANWIWEAIDSNLSCKIEEYYPSDSSFQMIVEQSKELMKNHTPKEIHNFLKDRLPNPKDRAVALRELSLAARGDLSGNIDYSAAHEYIKMAFEIDPFERWNAFWQMNSATEEMCKNAIQKLLPCGRNLPDEILSEILVCAHGDQDILNRPTIRTRGFLIRPIGKTPTMHHYKMLIDILNQRNVKLIAMQYPTLNIESLKQIISQNGTQPENLNGIELVSNEKNFNDALQKMKYEAIFKDRFRGSWGHTTQLGYNMIAENLLPVIQEQVRAGKYFSK